MAQSTDLIASIIHKVRGPLTVIHGASDILENSPVGPEEEKLLEVIATEAKEALEELTCLSDYIAILQHSFLLEKTLISLDTIVKQQIAFFIKKANTKGVEVTFSASGTPQPIKMDKERMVHAIHALLENSIKYNQTKGTVEVMLSYTTFGVTLTIKDSGPGIPQQTIQTIFQNTPSDGQKGIGLYLTKAIVDAHAGVLTIQADKKGSLVKIEIPAAFEEQLPAPDNPQLHS